MRVVNWRPMVFSDSRLNSFWRIAFLSESTQVSEASGSIDMSDVVVLGSWPTVCVAAERSSRIAPLRGRSSGQAASEDCSRMAGIVVGGDA
nr:hypothetical protein Iba_chr01cCG0150 [Ipomoea batatas]